MERSTYIDGLEVELAQAREAGDKTHEKEVQAELSRAKGSDGREEKATTAKRR